MIAWLSRNKGAITAVITVIAASPFIPGWGKLVVSVFSSVLANVN
jgi:hypothetical protein